VADSKAQSPPVAIIARRTARANTAKATEVHGFCGPVVPFGFSG
jgi:hypothetical protein